TYPSYALNLAQLGALCISNLCATKPLPLRKNTKVRLKELAELYNISESELLEKLINKEYEEYKDYK
ncbi:hypothetical protein HX122_10605, partial [Acinetobacter towneri]|nr:hypothetical protein [Acinetobacter towneri]